ncbi:hypothetical protein [Paenibacillus sp. FSL H8-0034]|uniref:hypothetical protein n=1 Tax=Paenibacillus sp. FSL H8-0034 TaxID=2954671 RepID=UPI0030F54B8A
MPGSQSFAASGQIPYDNHVRLFDHAKLALRTNEYGRRLCACRLALRTELSSLLPVIILICVIIRTLSR